MTEIEADQEYTRRRHNAFCKAFIQYAAIGKMIRLRQKWEREISLAYLTNEQKVNSNFALTDSVRIEKYIDI